MQLPWWPRRYGAYIEVLALSSPREEFGELARQDSDLYTEDDNTQPTKRRVYMNYLTDPEALKVFRTVYSRNSGLDQGAVGYAPKTWAAWIATQAQTIDANTLVALPDTRVDRALLKAYAADASKPVEVAVLSILAWGGMNRRHGAQLLQTKSKWNRICSDLREGKLDRRSAYESFATLRSQGSLVGMGPAYFTKLIYFLHPAQNGYIMDQWTGRSTNTLFKSKIVQMTAANTVSDKNTPQDYETLCSCVEHLAERIATSPENIELMMFGRGGHKKNAWRTYVIARK
jgi:hypothetical protein